MGATRKREFYKASIDEAFRAEFDSPPAKCKKASLALAFLRLPPSCGD